MKLKQRTFLIALLVSLTGALHAQTDSTATDSVRTISASADSSISGNFITAENVAAVSKMSPVKQKQPLNIVKINLFGIALKNYQLQYERVISRKFSIAVSYRIMPMSSIPFETPILKVIDDEETADKIRSIRVGNSAITPEIRFYLSKKGYGRGFYIAPFYRHTSFTANGFKANYNTDGGGENSVSLSGKVTGDAGGILLGVQKSLGKHVVLDWWLLGPMYGSGKANLSGSFSQPLSQKEQDDLRDNLQDVGDGSTIKARATVTANSASVDFTGPFGGIRIGLNLGIRF